jgi:Flp pilus assembly pilin Flp
MQNALPAIHTGRAIAASVGVRVGRRALPGVFVRAQFFYSLYEGESSMAKLVNIAKRLVTRKEEGATMVEYALMLALIAAVSITMVTNIGNTALAAFSKVFNNF